MTKAKADAENLLNEVVPLAQDLLGKNGEFFPFAAALGLTGEAILISGHDGREQPPSKDLIGLLESGLRQGASAGEYIATALVYDVRVTSQAPTDLTDAIVAELEHRDGYAVTIFYPYALTNGQPILASPFATADSRAIFSR